MGKTENETRTIHFVSLGCPKNRVDTEVMAGVASGKGLEIVSRPEDADIIVVNTCAFIESAKKESIDTLLEMARHRKRGRTEVLVSAGCLSQRYGDDLAAEMPELTHLLGTETPLEIGEIIDGNAQRLTIGAAGHFLQKRETPRFSEPGAVSAYIKIADGCDRVCAFCAIPAIRGRAASRKQDEIVEEVHRLAAAGVKEVNLVAQDTTAYGRDLGDGADITQLLTALNDKTAIPWIRLSYLYPNSVTTNLMRAVRDLPKVVPYFDLPIQHVSPKMLRLMKRGGGPVQLAKRLAQIRRIVPGAFIRTSVLVGHPGETEEDFNQLLGFIESAQFDHLGVFRYSDEEGTDSHGQKLKVSAGVSYNRMRKVMAAQRKISTRNNRNLKGRIVEVLIERPADSDGFVLEGRHAGQAPEIDGATYIVSSNARVGQILTGRVIKTSAYDLVVAPA